MVDEKRKDALYFQLVRTCSSYRGCFLCKMEKDSVHRHIEGILYERVTDRGVREELIKERGYCHNHAHFLLSFKDGHGAALLYRDQVIQLRTFLTNLSDGGKGYKKRLVRWKGEGKCPACHYLENVRSRNIRRFAEGVHETEMRQAFEKSSGLCLPHFLLVMEYVEDDDMQDFLRSLQERNIARLMEELDAFIAKQDYQFNHGDFGDEKDSWVRAVLLMVGEKGLF